MTRSLELSQSPTNLGLWKCDIICYQEQTFCERVSKSTWNFRRTLQATKTRGALPKSLPVKAMLEPLFLYKKKNLPVTFQEISYPFYHGLEGRIITQVDHCNPSLHLKHDGLKRLEEHRSGMLNTLSIWLN